VTGLNISASGLIQFRYQSLSLGQTGRVSFQASLSTGINFTFVTTNTGQIFWTSTSGTLATSQSPHTSGGVERVGTGGLTNLYNKTSAVNNTFVFTPDVTKTLIATSEVSSIGNNVQI
jgi:hypothetical protein